MAVKKELQEASCKMRIVESFLRQVTWIGAGPDWPDVEECFTGAYNTSNSAILSKWATGARRMSAISEPASLPRAAHNRSPGTRLSPARRNTAALPIIIRRKEFVCLRKLISRFSRFALFRADFRIASLLERINQYEQCSWKPVARATPPMLCLHFPISIEFHDAPRQSIIQHSNR